LASVKLDENVPDSVATLLREAGHDVALARDEGLVGADDDRLLQVASAEHRVLVTLDRTSAIFAGTRRARRPASLCSDCTHRP
jgi:predicted nuclease of predicted toxin-antitoxin system